MKLVIDFIKDVKTQKFGDMELDGWNFDLATEC